MRYKLHIPFANREDLLRDAVASAAPGFDDIHVWATDQPDFYMPDVDIHHLPPIPATSTINLMIQSSWDDDVMFWMHNDGYALPGVAADFRSWIEGVNDHHRSNWGVAFTNYDVLCAFNMKAVREVGFWDTMFFQYVSDDDYYHRLELGNWPHLDYPNGAGVLHRKSDIGGSTEPAGGGGSNTVLADPLFNKRVQFRAGHGFDQDYYRLKWGGLKGHEQFQEPFNPNSALGRKA